MTIGTITGPLAGTNAPTSANPLSVVAAGTTYSLTGSMAAVDFGTTDPILTINAPGTYLIIAYAEVLYSGATFAASKTVTLKLRRTNNTAADVGGSVVTAKTDVVTTKTATLSNISWSCVYTTTNATDIIQMFGGLENTPSAGSVDIEEASIVAIRLQG